MKSIGFVVLALAVLGLGGCDKCGDAPKINIPGMAACSSGPAQRSMLDGVFGAPAPTTLLTALASIRM